jgi:hypothetical protein
VATTLGRDPVAPADLVDLDRYPLLDVDGPRLTAVVDDARRELAATGACGLAGFVRPEAMPVVLADAESLALLAHRSGGLGNAYLRVPDPDLPEDHPRRWTCPYSLGAVAYDLFPPESPIRLLYEWDPMLRLIEAVLDRGPLYRYADEYGALNLAVMRAGDQLQWHFDETDFVVSLGIRHASEGGDFEVAPRVRSADDECYGEVAAVLAGRSEGVIHLPITPGTLLIFEGRHSLHRVTPIVGPVERLVALLSYDTQPGTVSSERLRRVRYGRMP